MNTSLFRIDVSTFHQRAREVSRAQPTYGDRRLSVLELAQRRRTLLHAQAVADAVDKLGMRRTAEDNSSTHRGRAEKCDVLVVSKLRCSLVRLGEISSHGFADIGGRKDLPAKEPPRPKTEAASGSCLASTSAALKRVRVETTMNIKMQ
jgi:hypothetical protein